MEIRIRRAAFLLVLPLLVAPRSADADVVLQWNEVLIRTIPAPNPFVGTRVAAITHLAIFEAVNAITGEYEPYLGTVTAPPGASPEAAAAAAARDVLAHYFPASIPALDAELADSLALVPDGPWESDGIAVGKAAAAAMIALRANDGSVPTTMYLPESPGVGEWALYGACTGGVFFNWRDVTPFGVESTSRFRSVPPPLLNTGRYANDYDEVRRLGALDSHERPVQGTELARLYAALLPAELWNRAARQLAEANPASLPSNARLFALLNMSMADALMTLFETKYHYLVWRPITAIHEGDNDGSDRTSGDPDFATLLPTPCYPAYPSGHAGVSNAGRGILQKFYGNGRHWIVLDHANLPGVAREYTHLGQIADDIDDARIYAGIHFRFDQEAAVHLGTHVANYVFGHYLRPR
jgi:hypothetical protein